MCGIAGILNLTPQEPVNIEYLKQMLALIRHRGPDQFGIYRDELVGLGHARLSILDLYSGQQPISNEDETIWIVFNGEIFNYIELRSELVKRGHCFRTQSDTEVIIHLYEECGPRFLEQLNGQFAFAIWDSQQQILLLGRDRLGVRPLFYTILGDRLVFASEVKAILSHPSIQAAVDPLVLHEIFTFWAPLGEQTIFNNIKQIQPGHFLLCQNGEIIDQTYWQLEFLPEDIQAHTARSFAVILEQFRELLIDATRIRLRADVPVGAYLSGGVDSSTLSAIILNYTQNQLDTFSISFSDPEYDESIFQQQMADFLGTAHHSVHTSDEIIGQVYPQVIWHTETPVLRTAPAPMFLLSKLVHEHQFKVIMTGEGADEFLAGYDIFKEERIRHFWAEEPDSEKRSRLLEKLYPDIQAMTQTSQTFLTEFFRRGLLETNRPDYSHMLRWFSSSRALRFFSGELRQAAPNWEQQLEAHGEALGIPYPVDFMRWHPLHRAQYLEIVIFLSGYLLSSQGDRVAMAHSVEGRHPFLDHRLVEFSNRLPPGFKLRGLTEKYILKQLSSKWLPAEIYHRNKRPYRAPIQNCFFPVNAPAPAYVEELLAPSQVKAAGYFNPVAVNYLVRKIKQGSKLSESDSMALVGILSTQLVHQAFVADFRMPQPLSDADKLKICSKVRN